ncbi:MAG: calcium-binding protein, partial [Cyanobacteria bacterium J06598_3]
NLMPLEAKVTAASTATITANALNVAADFTDVQKNTSAEHDRAWELRIWTPFGTITITMDFGSTDQTETYTPEAYIDFNANVNLLARDVNPVLVIDETGKVSQQSAAGMVEVGEFVVVKDILNNHSGAVNFSTKNANSGSFADRATYDVLNPAFDTVEITNYSDKDLVVNDISTLSTGATTTANYSAVKTSKTIATTYKNPNPATLPVNPTQVTVNNLGESDLVLKGVIDSASNRVVLYSTGNIRTEGAAQNIIARELSVESKNGSIGTLAQRLSAQLDQGHRRLLTDPDISEKNKLEANAKGSIYLDLGAQRVAGSEPVTVNIEKIDALTGEINITARKTTDVNGQEIAAHYAFSDPRMKVGTNAIFDAGENLISIEAKSDFLGEGVLDVVTGGAIDWTALTGPLNVKRAISKTDTVTLTAQSTADTTLIDGAEVIAASDVTIAAGGNVHFNQTASITAEETISLRGDLSSNTGDTVVNWDGEATAQEIELNGGINDTIFNIRRLTADTVTKVTTGQGEDVINVSDADNTLSLIEGELDIRGANSSSEDTLNVTATGSNIAQSGKLTDRILTGLGMARKIVYSNLEALVINLGSGDDELAVLRTGAATTVNGNGGNDSLRVGANLTTSGQGLSESVDGASISANRMSGIDHETTLTGGEGNDSFTVNRNVERLTLQGNGGDDTLTVNTPVEGSRLLANGEVAFEGGAGTDNVTVNTALSSAITRPDNVTIDVENSRRITVDASTESVTPEGDEMTDNSNGGADSTSSQELFDALLNGTQSEGDSNTGNNDTNSGSTPSDNGDSGAASDSSASSLFDTLLNK